ncbi:MBL fold metallo-hydrolase [Qipengyuania vesicularis]|uniref:MBL fold metallo-hydrolase n=1 Tax=Qipengyuania vesicularis TaxID=2867232 RepID=UPI001C8795F7|nr:MBL fold metallo-hydrolase [Qipengyuania vesicularis]MBX7527904.1 MBL fold metallo-hydrolase [Qipengyuania vesicularis]
MVKKAGIILAGLVAFALVAAIAFQAQIGTALFKRAVEQNNGRDSLAALEDGLHVGLCGTGSPMPNPDRAGPCNLVVAGKQVFVVDIGEGGVRNLAMMGVDVGRLDALLLTHFHSDHIDGFGPLMLNFWIRGTNTSPLQVYGPSGVEAIVDGFNAAYATDDTYRTAHHGEDVAPSTGGGAQARVFDMAGDSVVVLERDGLTVTVFKVQHAPVDPAVGYRFDYKGRSLCISGDTAKSTNLERACKGAELIVHEALQPALVAEMETQLAASGNASGAKIMVDIQDYHASPEDAADSAQLAGARMLVLSHLVPPLPSKYLYPALLGDAENRFDGDLVVGEDGMLFSLPAGSDAINTSELI